MKLENLTGTNNQANNSNSPLRYLTATSVIGDNVVNREGEDLGQIVDIMLNINTGKIEYYVIEFGGFLGIGDKLFTIPFALLTVDPEKQVFVFEQQKGMLEKAPGFDRDHWPETNTHYDEADEHWNFM